MSYSPASCVSIAARINFIDSAAKYQIIFGMIMKVTGATIVNISEHGSTVEFRDTIGVSKSEEVKIPSWI